MSRLQGSRCLVGLRFLLFAFPHKFVGLRL